MSTILHVANTYNVLPSDVVGIEGIYSTFCFNQACFYYQKLAEDGKRTTGRESTRSNSNHRPRESGKNNDFLKGIAKERGLLK